MDEERRLVRAAREGGVAAAEELVVRHFQPTWRAAYAICQRRDLADDVTQDAFERFFRSFDRFDDTRPLAPWLHRIVVNCALSVMRAERGGLPLDERTPAPPGVGDPELSSQVRELFDVLADLDPDRRAVVALRLILGYDPQETARILGVRPGTVHSRLSRALEQIRVVLRMSDVG